MKVNNCDGEKNECFIIKMTFSYQMQLRAMCECKCYLVKLIFL